VGLLVAGCATYTPSPSPLSEIYKARDAIAAAKQAGAAERFPNEFVALEKRYKQTRLTYYSCQETKARVMAQELAADANALAAKRIEVPKPTPAPPAAPANHPPQARLKASVEGNVKALLTFYATDSSDPDGDKLTYHWDFGDGKTASFTFPVATHRYAKPGNYTVQLLVDDGRGGSDTTTVLVTIVSRQVILGDVLFDVDSARLKPEAEQVLANVLRLMQDDPTLRAEIVGHTDSTASNEYNMRLSQRRAQAVRDYLEAKGIPITRIRLDWKGETQPVASNDTPEGRAQNRRVEITLRPLPVQ
jgi:outer membrane protein OmpA-like peptidoglycan-associated protein